MSFVAEPVPRDDPRQFPFWRTQVEFSVERIEVFSADDVRVELNAATKAVIQSLSGRLRRQIQLLGIAQNERTLPVASAPLVPAGR